MKLFLAILAVNVGSMAFGVGSAISGSDPVVVAFAIYGLTHIEWLMVRAIIWLVRNTPKTSRA